MKRDMNRIIDQIRSEVANLNEALTVIEVSQNSIKRDRYCKKKKISYSQFMGMFTMARNEILMYPVVVQGMKAVIDLKKSTKKEYESVHKNIIDILTDLIEKAKQKDTPEIKKMEKVLQEVKGDTSGANGK